MLLGIFDIIQVDEFHGHLTDWWAIIITILGTGVVSGAVAFYAAKWQINNQKKLETEISQSNRAELRGFITINVNQIIHKLNRLSSKLSEYLIEKKLYNTELKEVVITNIKEIITIEPVDTYYAFREYFHGDRFKTIFYLELKSALHDLPKEIDFFNTKIKELYDKKHSSSIELWEKLEIIININSDLARQNEVHLPEEECDYVSKISEEETLEEIGSKLFQKFMKMKFSLIDEDSVNITHEIDNAKSSYIAYQLSKSQIELNVNNFQTRIDVINIKLKAFIESYNEFYNISPNS